MVTYEKVSALVVSAGPAACSSTGTQPLSHQTRLHDDEAAYTGQFKRSGHSMKKKGKEVVVPPNDVRGLHDVFLEFANFGKHGDAPVEETLDSAKFSKLCKDAGTLARACVVV